MVSNSLMSSAASALTAGGIVLTLANWYTKPDAALAWAGALAMFAVMIAVLRLWRRTTRTEATPARVLNQIPTAVVFAALMMGLPLALTLARSYGLVDSIDIARRSTGILIGVFIAMLGNVIPKNLPPLSPVSDGARQQAFHRRMGWTWALCGLASAIGWLALPIEFAETSVFVVWPAAMVVTILLLRRLSRSKGEPAHGLD